MKEKVKIIIIVCIFNIIKSNSDSR